MKYLERKMCYDLFLNLCFEIMILDFLIVE